MLTPEPLQPIPSDSQELFEGLLSDSARAILARGRFISFARSSDADVDAYVRGFSQLWARVGDGFMPDPKEVLRQMEERETILLNIWKLALRKDFSADSIPLVVQAPVMRTANPLILRSSVLKRPLVVMSEGLWSFVSAAALGVLHWAEGNEDQEAAGKRLFLAAAAGWVTNDPERQPSGTDVAEATTVEMDVSTFAVGLADAAFTWAFLHEMGHLALGHLPASEVVRGMSADGTAIATSLTYEQSDELAADAFAFDRYLGLMPFTAEIRKTIRFGPQIDHAPIVMFELMDLAYRVTDSQAMMVSNTHPSPLERASHLMVLHGDKLSEEGRDWYAYWCERLNAFKAEVLA